MIHVVTATGDDVAFPEADTYLVEHGGALTVCVGESRITSYAPGQWLGVTTDRCQSINLGIKATTSPTIDDLIGDM